MIAPTEPSHDHEFWVLPSARRPRLALPLHAPRAAAAMLRRYSHDLTYRSRTARTLLAGVIGLPGVGIALGSLLPRRMRVTAPFGSDVRPLEARLREILGEPVVVSVGVGTHRANRKPVLQASTPGGRTLAFVKVGGSPLTADLVRGEAQALRTFWSSDEQPWYLDVPRILHHARWRDRELLVLSPLRTRVRRWQPRDAEPTFAMRELAERLGTRRRPFAESPFWTEIRATPGKLRDDRQATTFGRVVETVGARYGAVPMRLGAWHGDWTPWNMAWHRARVLLWDFERFAIGTPLGFDLAHYRLQSALRTAGEPEAERVLGPRLTGLATGWGAAELLLDNDADAVSVGYLVELTRRYLLASQPPEGVPLRGRTRWLLDLLDRRVVRA